MKIIGDMGQPMDRRTALRGSVSTARRTVRRQHDSSTEQRSAGSTARTSDRADIGSLFPDIEHLVSRNQYPYSFLTSRFRSLEEYRAAGRRAVLDALGYQPAWCPLPPR